MNVSVRSHVPLKKSSILFQRGYANEPDRILSHLSQSQLLVKYLRGVIIEETLEMWARSPEFASIARRIDPSILNKNRQLILLNSYKQTQLGCFVRSRFLARKSQLDRVLFSIVQVRDIRLAEELYCRVTDRPQSLIQLATIYSESQTAKTGGSIGPISPLQLHPQIQHHLIGLQPKQLSPIFQLEEHYIFLRLDRWLPVQLNPQIEQQLLDEIFEEWLQPQILDRVSKTRMVISHPVMEVVDPIDSSRGELTISSNLDLDLDSEPLDPIAPTSSFFFPEISTTGKILPPHITTREEVDSSFFLPQKPPIRNTPAKYRRDILGDKVFAFFVFFRRFLTSVRDTKKRKR
jgi:hypothetical protein